MAQLLVILPARNESQALPAVFEELAVHVPDVDVLLVDDCSVDATREVAEAAGVPCVSLPLNLGVGGAMRTGYRYARDHGYDYAVQLDADGQHPAEQIPRLLARMEETGADIVIGARFAGEGEYAVRGPRSWAMRFLARVLSRRCGTKLTDTTSGFKLMNRRACSYFAENMPSEYLGDTIEALVMASKAGLKVEQVGVQMRPRQAGEASHGPVASALLLFRGIVAMAVAATRPRITREEDTHG